MRRRPTRLFLIEVTSAAIASVLAVVTFLWHEWIEIVFGVDPDDGSGALEWQITLAIAAVAVACAFLAGREWRRSSSAAA